MGIRLNKLGGTNFTEEGLRPTTDLVPTLDAMLSATGNLAAEQASKTLAASGSYENGGSTAAENFNVAGGANGTVNIGSTDANFSTDKYELATITEGNPLTEVVSNQESTFGSVNNNYGLVFTPVVDIVITTATKMSTDQSTRCRISTAINGGGTILDTVTAVGDVATFTNNIVLTAGTTYYINWDDSGASRNVKYDPSSTYPITNAQISIDSAFENGTIKTDRTAVSVSITSDTSTFSTTSEVVCDTNTLAIDSETNAFCLDWKGTFPTDTSGSFDLIDYTNNTPDGVETTSTLTSPNVGSTSSVEQGDKFQVVNNCYITEVTIDAAATPTKAYLRYFEGALIEEVAIVSSVATFSSLLSTGVDYELFFDSEGASYSYRYVDGMTAPTTFSNIIYLGGWQDTTSVAYRHYFIENIKTEGVSSVANQTINYPVDPITGKTGVISKGALGDITFVTIKAKLGTTNVAFTPTLERWGIVKL